MLCLGIESSCDESALALVQDGNLIAQVLQSQVNLHALFGGVVPELASREHGRSIAPLFDQLLAEANLKASAIDCIAVARGPGLLGSLLVGITFAKSLAFSLNKPILGINHLHAHLFAAGLEESFELPALALLVSGGHTHLYLIKSLTELELLGRSIDDAAGEAIDKFGKMLALPYPAGKFIDEFSKNALVNPKLFPCPYLDNSNLDFSFSGLKTAAFNYLEKNKHLKFVYADDSFTPCLPEGDLGAELSSLCASFLYTVAQTLKIKLGRAIKQANKNEIKTLVLAGGVAANSVVRNFISELAAENNFKIILPSLKLCTDNAAMIAYTGYLMFLEGYAHDLNFAAIARGQEVPNDYKFKIV